MAGIRTDHAERSALWRGSNVGYGAAHTRVRRARGPARCRECACGAPAKHWAYDHSDPDEKTSPEGQPYSPDPAHYVAMCVPCHRRKDHPDLKQMTRPALAARGIYI